MFLSSSSEREGVHLARWSAGVGGSGCQRGASPRYPLVLGPAQQRGSPGRARRRLTCRLQQHKRDVTDLGSGEAKQ